MEITKYNPDDKSISLEIKGNSADINNMFWGLLTTVQAAVLAPVDDRPRQTPEGIFYALELVKQLVPTEFQINNLVKESQNAANE